MINYKCLLVYYTLYSCYTCENSATVNISLKEVHDICETYCVSVYFTFHHFFISFS